MSKKRREVNSKVLMESSAEESSTQLLEADITLNGNGFTNGGTNMLYSPSPSKLASGRMGGNRRRKTWALDAHDSVKTEEPIFRNTELLVNNINKWKNWRIRTIWTIILLSGFVAIIYAGHIFCALLIVSIQMFAFREIIHLSHVPAREKRQMRSFRLVSWYFLLTTLHFFYGEKVFELTRSIWIINRLFSSLARHHRFISFSLYIAGLVFFVLLLEKGHYRFQFSQFFWTHMTLWVVVVQSHVVIHNLLAGLIWFIMPAMLVIVNDIMAYICGFFFGRTPLIQLSPKKTWEGFIGAWLSTSLFAFFFARFLIQFDYMTCSYAEYYTLKQFGRQCTLETVFIPIEYKLTQQLVRFLSFFNIHWYHVYIAPIQWHALAMALFASLLAPFGGFFASGFKRAFKIKDFGDSIPGHGGIMDRFDCQFLMGLFAYLYHTSFIKQNYLTIDSILKTIGYLNHQDQLDLFFRFKNLLQEENLL